MTMQSSSYYDRTMSEYDFDRYCAGLKEALDRETREFKAKAREERRERADLYVKRNTYAPDKPGWKAGFEAALIGTDPADWPHGLTADVRQAWQDGWHHGDRERRRRDAA